MKKATLEKPTGTAETVEIEHTLEKPSSVSATFTLTVSKQAVKQPTQVESSDG